MGFLSHSLCNCLIRLGLSKAGGISIAVTIRSLDRGKRGNRRFDDRQSHSTALWGKGLDKRRVDRLLFVGFLQDIFFERSTS